MRSHVTACCAICAADIVGEVAREPLGKDGALVAVCFACTTEQPHERQGPEVGYEPSGGLPTVADATRGARRAMGNAEYERATAVVLEFSKAPSRPVPEGERVTRDYDAHTQELWARYRKSGSAPNIRQRRGREVKPR